MAVTASTCVLSLATSTRRLALGFVEGRDEPLVSHVKRHLSNKLGNVSLYRRFTPSPLDAQRKMTYRGFVYCTYQGTFVQHFSTTWR
ncbi:hypothetical protein LZ31DRAFT_557394 [Colletotrichum somersetense]|nr:hypothetical protein LZ31DRAFT_557394 [Colletotrichum somersetense]